MRYAVGVKLLLTIELGLWSSTNKSELANPNILGRQFSKAKRNFHCECNDDSYMILITSMAL